MDIRNNKGYLLPVVILFIIITTMASIGIYEYVANVYMQAGIKEVEYIKGYYLDVAGLWFASILLNNVSGNFNVNISTNQASPTIVDVRNPNPNPLNPILKAAGATLCSTFVTNVGLQAPRDIILSIWKDTNGQYNVSASYDY